MKRTLYVVDDQAPLLEMAVLLLRTLNPRWEVIGFSDPLKALEAVKAKPPELVLSDQLMPGMQGSELLEQIRSISPTTVRIIMSGYVPPTKLALITSAHQYIAKPFNVTALRDMVKRCFAAQERIVNQGLQTVATGLRFIPSLPVVHQMLLRELKDNQSGLTSIARMVAEDPGLSLKVLHLANSPLFGSGYLVTSPLDAVMCLGTEMITSIVLSQSLFRHYEPMQQPEMDLKRVWKHSWETAGLAHRICRDARMEADTFEEAFLAGLMHEIGRFVLMENFPDQFKVACVQARLAGTPLAAHLRESCHASPAQIGAYVLQLWGLPQGVVDAIAGLDNPAKSPETGFTVGTALYIADHITSGKFPADSFPVEEWKTEYLKSVGCLDQIPAWEEAFTESADQVAVESRL